METGGAFHGYRKLPNTNSAPGGGVLKSDQMKNSNSNNNSNSNGGDESECTVREQDRFMPIANVIRIMRKILPAHAKISDDAKETIQECVSEYISFITGEANERCQREQRKTITAEDVLWAMSKLGFDDYIEPLTIYLHRFRDLEGDRTSSIRQPDPLAAKRTLLDYAPPPLGAAFVPHQFHIPHPHPNGYFGAPTYMRPAGGSSHHHQPSSLTDNNNNNNAETCNNGGQYK